MRTFAARKSPHYCILHVAHNDANGPMDDLLVYETKHDHRVVPIEYAIDEHPSFLDMKHFETVRGTAIDPIFAMPRSSGSRAAYSKTRVATCA